MSPKFQSLLQALKEATEAGRIEWEDTADEDTFRTHLGQGMVSIRCDSIPNLGQDNYVPGESFYTAWLMNSRGDVADHVEAYPPGRDYYDLKSLHDMARRKARNADALLDSMLGVLQRQASK